MSGWPDTAMKALWSMYVNNDIKHLDNGDFEVQPLKIGPDIDIRDWRGVYGTMVRRCPHTNNKCQHECEGDECWSELNGA